MNQITNPNIVTHTLDSLFRVVSSAKKIKGQIFRRMGLGKLRFDIYVSHYGGDRKTESQYISCPQYKPDKRVAATGVRGCGLWHTILDVNSPCRSITTRRQVGYTLILNHYKAIVSIKPIPIIFTG